MATTPLTIEARAAREQVIAEHLAGQLREHLGSSAADRKLADAIESWLCVVLEVERG